MNIKPVLPAVVAMTLTAAAAAAAGEQKDFTEKEIISTKLAPAAVGPYSQAVKINGWLFVSGQIPLDPAAGKIAGEDITAQTEQVMRNIAAILREAGYGMGDVVKTTCFLADINDFAKFNAVYGKYFTANPPARSCLAAAALPKGALLELELIACKRKQEK